MSLSTVLKSVLDMSVEADDFYRLIMTEIKYWKGRNGDEAWIEFPYNKYVFACAAILKGVLEEESYKVELKDCGSGECSMSVTWKNENDVEEKNVAENTVEKTVENAIQEADRWASENNFDLAIRSYDNMIEKVSFDLCMEDRKDSELVSKIMFKIVLCALASNDVSLYKTQLDIATIYEWKNNEIAFLEKIVQNVINRDIKSFTETVCKFNAVSPLDWWTTTMLLKIKNNIST